MALSLTDLPGASKRILTAFAAQLAIQGVQLPDRQYVTPGSTPVWDDEQLTVSLMNIAQGDPGLEHPGVFFPPQAAHYYGAWSVNLVRRVTVINVEGATADFEVPTVDEMGGDGQTLIADAGQLVLAAQALHTAGMLADSGQGMAIGPLAPVGPSGGLAGSRLLISLSLS